MSVSLSVTNSPRFCRFVVAYVDLLQGGSALGLSLLNVLTSGKGELRHGGGL